MPQWVRTDYHYEPRMATLCLTSRDCLRLGKLELRSMVQEHSPEDIEKIVLGLIEELRPDLSGGCLYAIRYNLHPPCWGFDYFHGSFPAARDVGRLPRQDLITGNWWLGESPEELKAERENG
jgi:hypothetical protein